MTIDRKAKDTIESQAVKLAGTVTALVINDDDSYLKAGETQKAINALRSKISEFFDPHVKRAYDAWKALTAERKAAIDPLDVALTTVQRGMGKYKAELERQRLEEEAVLRAQAAEEARAANEAMAQHFEDDDPFSDPSPEAEAIRSVQEQVVNQAVAAVHVENLAPKVDGQVARATWKFEIADAALIPREFLTPDLKAIGAFVRARKSEAKIPGVRTYPDYKVSVNE